MSTLRLGELLISKNLLTEAQLKVAIAHQAVTGNLLGDSLIKLGFVTSKEVAQALAEQVGMEFLNLDGYTPEENALRLISRDIAQKANFLPLTIENGVLKIAINNPSNILAIDTATRISGKSPKVYMVDSESFYEILERAYYFLENPIHKRIEGLIKEVTAMESPPATLISSFAELLFMDGIRRNATDIHISPANETVHVFYRIDGVLQHAHCLPKIVKNGIISKIKILSSLDIAEQRLPQDGSFTFDFLSKKYGMRVSTVPTIYGENLVIRILSSSAPLLRISRLGFDENNTQQLLSLFLKPFGIILITGPTGSGKTTTLYAALREINLLEKNVLTVEDPVEYRLSMVRQTEVSEKAGYDFAVGGRNFMRQDPDVMLIGEIRDEKTAGIAIRSSITGHLVLTTLHTNDAVTAIPRLIDLKVDRYLLSSSLLAIVAQRLVRKICNNCKIEYQIAEGELKTMGFAELEGKIKIAFKGRGCYLCNHTGYLGRIAIGEILVVNDDIKELIYSGASVKKIKDFAVKNGMKTMRDDGIRKAIEGITTFQEIVRVTG